MSYIIIEDFKRGLDRSRSALTSVAGSLQTLTNAHITRGGEIEKRKAFVPFATLPANTFGLHTTGSALYVFGSASAPSMPTGVTYQQLQHASDNMTGVFSTQNFNSAPYVIATFDTPATYHFFNSYRVTDWDTIAGTLSSNILVAGGLATAIDASAYYAATNGGTAVITITGQTNVDYRVATQVIGGGVTTQTMLSAWVSGPGVGAGKVTTVTIGGTYNLLNQFLIRLTDPDTGRSELFHIFGGSGGTGTVAKTFDGKMYAVASSLLYFSEINAPRQFLSQSRGAGFIDMSNRESRADSLTALATYQGQLAVFSRRSILLWSMDPDPVLNRRGQVLSDIGTVCPKSVVSLGDLDVLFLADSGIRSLRARDATNAATVSDIGTPIDALVAENHPLVGAATARRAAVGLVDPVDGRYWLAIGSKIYVFSYFPSGRISAWSTYDLEFTVTDMVHQDGIIYVRGSDDIIYAYGGTTGLTYDSCAVTATLPFLDAGKAGHDKRITSFDVSVVGEWVVSMNTDVSNPGAFEICGTVEGSTWSSPDMQSGGIGTHIELKLTNAAPGPAKIENLALHFELLRAG